jgi:hypothetical protein
MKIAFPIRFGLLAFLVASTVAAQQPHSPTDPSAILTAQRNQTAQLAASWLNSGDPRLQAWGAYAVLQNRQTELIPDLVALADAYEVSGLPVVSTLRDQHDAMLAILDALIQLDPPISGDKSARLYSEFPTQSLILLSRGWISQDSLNSSNSALLEIFRSEHSQRAWLAAGNILAERRADGFAASVLGSMTVHMNLLVTIPLRSEGAFGEFICGDRGAEQMEERSDWPEIGTYELVKPGPGARLLADGVDPAYYARKVSRLYDREVFSWGECNDVIPNSWDLLRQHYLTRLLGEPREKPSLEASIYRTIIWKNGDDYVAHLKGFVQQEQVTFAEMALRLKSACLITDDEVVAAKPHLEITIVDEREDKATPLPRAENLGGNVTIKM